MVFSVIGSGKTSLLDAIACRTNGTVSGKIYYNNIECTKDIIQQYATYVMQADRLLPNLTVRETLRYSAHLRLPGNTTSFDIEEKVLLSKKHTLKTSPKMQHKHKVCVAIL